MGDETTQTPEAPKGHLHQIVDAKERIALLEARIKDFEKRLVDVEGKISQQGKKVESLEEEIF